MIHCTGFVTHPAILNESRTLFCAQAPSIDYKLGFPSYVLEEKMLSTAQIEAISRACQAHEKFLPSGERMGFDRSVQLKVHMFFSKG